MKKVALFLFILIICSIVILNYLKSDDEKTKWTNPEAWKKLEKDMTRKQVEELLGKPGQIIRRGAVIRWYYQDLPREIHEYPEHGYISFEPTESSKHLDYKQLEWEVHDWVEPNWNSKEVKEKLKESQ